MSHALKSSGIRPEEKRLPVRWLGRLRKFLAVIVKIFKTRRIELRMALIFLALIVIPSGILTYLSWRAVENEKLLSQERLKESYRHLARLAAQIDDELRKPRNVGPRK
jgi:hypothetical protein